MYPEHDIIMIQNIGQKLWKMQKTHYHMPHKYRVTSLKSGKMIVKGGIKIK